MQWRVDGMGMSAEIKRGLYGDEYWIIDWVVSLSIRR